ncbi:hypothetical protein EYF80_043833 [Liparis tanakae]|uniref:Uncharacterized protein n=1 Tax=Liparis tanakae TaxID=230148 RepID=A0A4Z2G071_9TELE|nr:hypothetical protein EYF80_043833 [Liparis tanakae]
MKPSQRRVVRRSSMSSSSIVSVVTAAGFQRDSRVDSDVSLLSALKLWNNLDGSLQLCFTFFEP